MKTLYVSDLDGTLLHSDATLSPFTADAVNALIERGMRFSYATARSNYTAGSITAALSKSTPVIVYNGTFILENGTQKRLLSNAFSKEEAEYILRTCMVKDVYPFTYAFVGGEEKFSYSEMHLSPDMQEFLVGRQTDTRKRPTTVAHMFDGEIFHFTAMDTAEKLQPLYEKLKDAFACQYGNDLYSGKPWLEVYPRDVAKSNAVLQLKKLLGCDKVVCFGDGKNDISMFLIADECYAVENAAPELKAIATAVIGNNNDDAVAKWLLENYKGEAYAD